MQFYDDEHKKYYDAFIERDCTKPFDSERKSLFYVLALNEETRTHIDSIYNFIEHWINFECLDDGWQTSGSSAITKYGFNMYNGFNGEWNDNKYRMTPLDLFCHADSDVIDYLFYAMKIRLNQI